jgi:hypothetical protein
MKSQVKRHEVTQAVRVRGTSLPRFTPKSALAGQAGLRDGRSCGPVRESGERVGYAPPHRPPEGGYHALAGGQAWHDHVRTGAELPSGQRVIGLRQVDEMALGPGRLVGANPERLTRQQPTLSNT